MLPRRRMRPRFKLPITGLSTKRPINYSQWGGFTLIELLVATTVLLLIMALVLSMTDQTSKVWRSSTAKIQSFQGARAAYDTMTARLRQATLNTYLDYYDNETPPEPRNPSNGSSFVPYYYARDSDLHFVVDQCSNIFTGTPALHPAHAVFFQAPMGFTTTSSYGPMQNMLNACGYYVEFNTDKPSFPPFLGSSTVVHERYRYRLMEFLQPSEANTIYKYPYPVNGTPALYDQWFENFLPTTTSQVNSPTTGAPYHVLAENIIALIISPELASSDQSIAPNYTYDSRAGTITNVYHHQLPPLLRVVMVAIDEPSAIRLIPDGTTTAPTFISTLFQGTTKLFQTPYNPPFNASAPVSNPPPNNLDADLNTLSQVLIAHKVNYRIFDTDIAIRGAKWSTQ